jgi:hypothetical protein
LSFEGFDKFVVHGAGVSLVQGSNDKVVAGGRGRDEDELTLKGNLTNDGEIGVEDTQDMAKMNEDLAGTGAPDVLAFSLNLPI